MPFFQSPPVLTNQYLDDDVLRGHLQRVVPADIMANLEPSLERMGALAAGPLLALAHEHRRTEPALTSWNAWGRRVDVVRVSPAWDEYARVAVREGLVAHGYAREHGPWSRMHQFTLVYLFAPSSLVYTCPLAMTDGCARTLEVLDTGGRFTDVRERLTTFDPERAWTSGQWMTERTGGSDVGISQTVAVPQADGTYRLHGTKWFTSAIGSDLALTLARPAGNGPGGKGLALFCVKLRNDDGTLNGIVVNRLKDKLGTRSLPTAELELQGTIARLVDSDNNGVAQMAPMLNVTRTWNAVASVASMRRGLALARDYAHRRVAFGAPLSEKPLHLDTLASLAAEHEAALHLVFHEIALMGRVETGVGDEWEARLLAVLQPLTKLLTGKMAVACASEVLECFGGAGYVEDTGLPMLLRDAQVLPIWEGTTNVLALETLRALGREDASALLLEAVKQQVSEVTHPELAALGTVATDSAASALRWADETAAQSRAELEGGARRFAMTLGRAFALALTVRHAAWQAHTGGATSRFAARRFAAAGIDLLSRPEGTLDDTRALALGADRAASTK